MRFCVELVPLQRINGGKTFLQKRNTFTVFALIKCLVWTLFYVGRPTVF